MTNERRYIQTLLSTGSLELRCFESSGDGKKIWSGVFDNYDNFAVSVRFAEKSGFDSYHTINPTNVRVTNDIKPFRRASRDCDISEIHTIFFDFDPIRDTGTAATDEQIIQSLIMADELAAFLASEGWKSPTQGMSGNGAHLRYATNININDKRLLDGLYKGLQLRFSSDEIGFDISVRNPSRIARLLGTTNRKAGRRSLITSISGDFTDGSVILATAKKITPPQQKKTWVKPDRVTNTKHIKTLDAVSLFGSKGLLLGESYDAGKWFVTCPWAYEHSYTGQTDSVVWQQDFPTFHCSHSHCSGRTMTDVIALWGVK